VGTQPPRCRRGQLLLGRGVEPFVATEIADADKVDVLRAYLRRWKAEVGVFFDGVSATSPEADLRRIAGGHPVFLVQDPPSEGGDEPR
jgi:hypothetical protein